MKYDNKYTHRDTHFVFVCLCCVVLCSCSCFCLSSKSLFQLRFVCNSLSFVQFSLPNVLHLSVSLDPLPPFRFVLFALYISVRVCLSVCTACVRMHISIQCIVVKFMFKLEINRSQLFIAIVVFRSTQFSVLASLRFTFVCIVFVVLFFFGIFFSLDFPLLQLPSHIDSIELTPILDAAAAAAACICAHVATQLQHF